MAEQGVGWWLGFCFGSRFYTSQTTTLLGLTVFGRTIDRFWYDRLTVYGQWLWVTIDRLRAMGFRRRLTLFGQWLGGFWGLFFGWWGVVKTCLSCSPFLRLHHLDFHHLVVEVGDPDVVVFSKPIEPPADFPLRKFAPFGDHRVGQRHAAEDENAAVFLCLATYAPHEKEDGCSHIFFVLRVDEPVLNSRVHFARFRQVKL